MSVVEVLQRDEAKIPRILAAGAIGNVLEWYDFAAYGYFASIFGRNFFPDENPFLSLLSAYGVFAVAYMMRPLGSILFGHIGDRFGRKQALVISAAAMALSTFSIGLLPTYAAVGVIAPILLIVLRMIQGVSVGGEYTTSIIFLVEQSAPNRRGFVGSWASFSATVGILLGSAVGVVVSGQLDPAELSAWGWRIPFLPGILLGAVAYVMRRQLIDEDFSRVRFEQLPLVEAFKTSWRDIVRGFAITIALAVGFYLVFVYLATYLQQVDSITASHALGINTISMILMAAVTPLFGALSDRVGRKVLVGSALVAIVVLSWPLFLLLDHPATPTILLGQCGFAILIAAFGAALPATLVELYPRRIRCSALSVSYNAAMGFAGGTAPMVAVYLMGTTRSPISPAIYLSAAAIVSLLALLTMTDRTGKPLR
jgi:MHS family proline/betaine transporter-like MFS transporter